MKKPRRVFPPGLLHKCGFNLKSCPTQMTRTSEITHVDSVKKIINKLTGRQNNQFLIVESQNATLIKHLNNATQSNIFSNRIKIFFTRYYPRFRYLNKVAMTTFRNLSANLGQMELFSLQPLAQISVGRR